MMISISVLQILICCIGVADFLPLSTASKQETRTFRWTTTDDLKNISCAQGFDLRKVYNFTSEKEWLNYIINGVTFSGFSTDEIRKQECESNSSHFMLVGNPGIVWHLETGQCMRTKMETYPITIVDDKVFSKTWKFLTAGYECEPDDPNVAHFKFNKNDHKDSHSLKMFIQRRANKKNDALSQLLRKFNSGGI